MPHAKTSDPAVLCDSNKLIARDPWLAPHANQLAERCEYLKTAIARHNATGGLLGQVSQGHHHFGFNRGELWGKPGVWYREWAPGAVQLRVIGDFNGWDRFACPM